MDEAEAEILALSSSSEFHTHVMTLYFIFLFYGYTALLKGTVTSSLTSTCFIVLQLICIREI